MKALTLAWLLILGSTFFAGIYGAVLTRKSRELRALRYLLLAKALDGLLVGYATVSLIQRLPLLEVRFSRYLTAWLIVRTVVAFTTWAFVIDISGRFRRHQ